MATSPSLLSAGFSMGAAFAWGGADYLGGFAARRANPTFLAAIVYGSGLVLMTALALLYHSPFPSHRAIFWALAAGCFAGMSLANFYRALSLGSMGITAPLTAVLAAAIPATVGIIREGLPSALQIAGFFLAAMGIWLISRTEGGTEVKGIGYAMMAGLGFAAFFLCIKQAGNGSAFWIADLSRVTSLLVTAGVVLSTRTSFQLPRISLFIAIFAGFLDVGGSVFFVRATQTGRLDSAVVLSSLYPVITVLFARIFLKEHFTAWKLAGIVASLVAVPLIAVQ
ncbi:MAG TPA: DMT family transporter [Terriglobales bacterium]|jgi:drug/metabolite transporter (DMT)-like permease